MMGSGFGCAEACDAGIRRKCLRKALILHMSEARILFTILGFGSFIEEK